MDNFKYTTEIREIEINGIKKKMKVRVFKTLDKFIGTDHICQIKGNDTGNGNYWCNTNFS